MKSVAADTHAILWFLEDDKRLSRTAAEALDSAERVLLPSICLVEIVYLIDKGRLHPAVLPRILGELNEPTTTLEVAGLDLGVIRSMQNISRNAVPDLPDRVIAATAWHHCVPIVTRDRQIQASGVQTIW